MCLSVRALVAQKCTHACTKPRVFACLCNVHRVCMPLQCCTEASLRAFARVWPCTCLLVGVQGERVPPDTFPPPPVAGTNYMLKRETWDLHDFSYPNEKNGNTYIGGGAARCRAPPGSFWGWRGFGAWRRGELWRFLKHCGV